MIVNKDQITVEFGDGEGVSAHISDAGTRTIILNREAARQLAAAFSDFLGIKIVTSSDAAKEPKNPHIPQSVRDSISP